MGDKLRIYDTDGVLQEFDPLDAPASLTKGDILYWNGTALVRLAIGTAGQQLTVSSGGVPEWAAAS